MCVPFANIIHPIATHPPFAECNRLMIGVASKKPESQTLIIRLWSRCRNDVEMVTPPVPKEDATGFCLGGFMLAVTKHKFDYPRLNQYFAAIID
jgi:hypothetical protein